MVSYYFMSFQSTNIKAARSRISFHFCEIVKKPEKHMSAFCLTCGITIRPCDHSGCYR